MQPDEILDHEFLAGDGALDPVEVRSFLAQVADEHARLLADLEAARAAVEAREEEDFDHLGSGIANILRTAREAATAITSEAEAVRAAAMDEAERMVRVASERVAQLELETEARIANKTDDVRRHEVALRARLVEASEEITLALLALDEPAQRPAANVDEEQSEPVAGH